METSKNKLKTEVRALTKNIKMSPHKMRIVIDKIRDCSYVQAQNTLKILPYRACYPIFQLLRSAAANATNNMGLKKELIISRIEVSEGPFSKRIQARAKGRAFFLRKQTCHLTIVLTERPD
uniref:Large ribosomal subunit protein uL22c n=1 Tax=Gnetum ula TaxID=3383 RepID=A0A0S3QPA1_9SPER|nr:ribosomal protein L22 [Gnetum ula]BAT70154.1 ribosomal protein L22 [Gnetum ula]